MFENYQICPYTGLRSFTEEESLYFKGRDEHIQEATLQLQKNKFLMLTGASGDGKSSLVYAGIIPNARSGFLKARYTNWSVADFRPERNPLENLCKSLARELGISNPSTVESELRHGFSALVDLYKNSKRFTDVASVDWINATEDGQAALKREAGNLIVLVDQFEEFFTNPENYNKGVPSTDSSLVLNVLLETARIALEEDLPIYIVFTMRSDYIGQCAAFRGLPEYIGFSQFFVPRLNRVQLQDVIEEPAKLSGNRITRRLTERLIHDLTEGVDQLPILQHALNQIWVAANNGQEEMDLVHYAMVGGLGKDELPENQVEKFATWFKDLPENIQACYHQPSLQNVLDTHANKMYEEAEEYVLTKTGKIVSGEDAKLIIKTTFQCLTKIDQSRAVRNRMTLEEIANILNRPDIDRATIGSVLNIFREPGNTFIRPFILEEEESTQLKKDDVLDITHESLIRNWVYLENWAEEEYDNYVVYLDYEQQLNRWVESNKSNDFLLSIGPLTYFEEWYNRVKPNESWMARYLPDDEEQKTKIQKAEISLHHAKDFLKRSTRKHIITRTLIRYGPKRIAAVLAIVALLTLSSFAVRNYLRQQNDFVLNSIIDEALVNANNKKLGIDSEVPLLNELIRTGNLTIPEIVAAIEDPLQRINTVNGIANLLVFQGRNKPEKEIYQSLLVADSLMALVNVPDDHELISSYLKEMIDFSVSAGFVNFYNPKTELEALVKSNATRSAKWVMHLLEKQPKLYAEMRYLNLALENGIDHQSFSNDEILKMINILSPFENANRTEWVRTNFHRDKLQIRGTQDYGFKFNGLYQELAYLYAATGNTERALQCMDTLLYYNQNYYQNDYGAVADNATNIALVFYQYEKLSALQDFIAGYCIKKKTTADDFLTRFLGRTLTDNSTGSNYSFYTGFSSFSNLSLRFSTDDVIRYISQLQRNTIIKIKDNDQRNFSLAVAHKNEGAILFLRKEMRGISERTEGDYLNYEKAINYYKQVSARYLNEPKSVVGISGAELLTMPAKFQFLYPDYRTTFHPFEPRAWVFFYNTYSFIDYVMDQQEFDQLYISDEDLKFFELWLSNYHAVMTTRDFFMRDPIPFESLKKLSDKLESRNAGKNTDLTLLYLHLGDEAYRRSDNELGKKTYAKIQPEKVLNSFRYKGFNFINTYSLEMVAIAVAHLSSDNQMAEAYRLINVFRKEVNRSSIYGYAAQLLAANGKKEIVLQLLDSAKIEMNRIDNPAVFQPNRHQVAIALMQLDPDSNSEEAYKTIKNSFTKHAAMTRFSYSFAKRQNLFTAFEQIPANISVSDQTGFYEFIVDGYSATREIAPEWKKYIDNRLFNKRRFLPYVNEDD